jgi:hypothetical protein
MPSHPFSTSNRALTIWLIAATVAVLAVLFALLVYCHICGREPFNYTDEDGLVERGAVVSFFACAGAAIAGAAGMKALTRRQRVFLLIFGLLCLAAIGEELSWGQRLFGFEPPKSMTGRDKVVRFGHGDVTIHNLAFNLWGLKFSVGGLLFKLPLLLGGIFHGLLLPSALRKERPWARRLVDRLGLFVPSLPLGIAMLTGIVAFYWNVWPHSQVQECREFFVPTVYFFILIEWFVAQRHAVPAAGCG